MKISLRTVRAERGVMLIECIAYIALITVVIGVASVAFFRSWDDSKHLRSNADDIVRALHAGEQWRADIRSASGPLRLTHEADFDRLAIPVKIGSINYYFSNPQSAVSRQVGDLGKPVVLLQHVKSSQMQADPRQNVTAWRWELELQSTQKKARVQPLFTFETVAGQNLSQ
jgi:hypothetical protein